MNYLIDHSKFDTDDAKAVVKRFQDKFRDLAKETVETSLDANKLHTTKDNYGGIILVLSAFDNSTSPKVQKMLFLDLMVQEGYPLITAEQIVRIAI